MDLQADLRARHMAGSPDPVLAAWAARPVRLTYTYRHRRCVWTLDGAGTLVWTRETGEMWQEQIVLVWDDGGGLALDVLRPHLVALVRSHAAHERTALLTPENSPSYRPLASPRCYSWSPERARGAWFLAHDVVRTEHVSPPSLLLHRRQPSVSRYQWTLRGTTWPGERHLWSPCWRSMPCQWRETQRRPPTLMVPSLLP